jgi:hypothetical protein
VDDPAFSELTPARARDLIDEDEDWENHGTVFLADTETMSTPGRNLLAVTGSRADEDGEEPRREFRLPPEAVVHVHLALSTDLSCSEIMEDVGEDGVYRYQR